MRKFFLFLLFLGFSFFAGMSPLWADCIELKQDKFDLKSNNKIGSVRSFCLSEYFGVIYKAKEDLTIEKVRILISSGGKVLSETFALHLEIYEEKGGANPGKKLFRQEGISGTVSNEAKPRWLEVKDLNVKVKKGISFRVVFGHDPVTCQPAPPKPVCAEECGWWSATIDAGPIVSKANVVLGRMFKCPSLPKDKAAWRFWKDLPASCRPSGNLIIRVLAATATGSSCKKGGSVNVCVAGGTQSCSCSGGKQGVQSCKADGSAWNACQCQGGKACEVNTTQVCTCSGGKQGVQSCKSDGSGWQGCVCNSAKTCAPGANQVCACPGGKQGVQSCKADGSAWNICQCSGGGGVDKKACVSGSTQVCLCPGKKQGVQNCKSDGSGWDQCVCEEDKGCGCSTNTSSPRFPFEPWMMVVLFLGLSSLKRRHNRSSTH